MADVIEIAQRRYDANYEKCLPVGWPAGLHPIGLASASCVFCRGSGLAKTRVFGKNKVCLCVYRAIFRACLIRYHRERKIDRRSIICEVGHGAPNHTIPGAEYVADFVAVAERVLLPLDREIFRLYCLEELEYLDVIAALADRRLLTKGDLFHLIYALMAKVGRVFVTLRPHRLFPLDEYFSCTTTATRIGYRPPRNPYPKLGPETPEPHVANWRFPYAA
jgi:hypothetical protein